MIPPRFTRPNRSALAVLLAVLGLAACVDSAAGPLPSLERVPVLVQPALIPSPADADALPINRIRTTTRRDPDGAVLGESSTDVDPNADEWILEVSVQTPGTVTAVIYLYLIHVAEDGSESVQFSGRTDPISLTPGEPVEPEVTVVRGPLSNLGVTSVQVTSSPDILLVGETGALAATAEFSGEAPTVFWTSSDPSVLETGGATPSATAVGTGTVSVIASAGAFSDTVMVTVIPADTIPPSIVSTSPVADAQGVALSTPISVTFDEPIAPASVNAASFTLVDSLGAMVPATVSVTGAVATLTPSAALDTLASYTASLAPGAEDPTGNTEASGVTWSFTTASGAALLSSFNAGRGLLVAIARDAGSGDLWVLDDFFSWIQRYDPSGQPLGDSVPAPGTSSNDIDLDVLTVPTLLGPTQLPVGTVLVNNGETVPGTIYGVDPTAGTVLDSIAIQSANQPVGGAHHPQRDTYFSVRWDIDLIDEVELSSGAVLNTFPVLADGSPTWDVFYGDLDVHPQTGNLYLVSSSQASIRILSPQGVWIRDVDLTGLGITGMSGIALDPATGTAWISSTTGFVFHVGGIG